MKGLIEISIEEWLPRLAEAVIVSLLYHLQNYSSAAAPCSLWLDITFARDDKDDDDGDGTSSHP